MAFSAASHLLPKAVTPLRKQRRPERRSGIEELWQEQSQARTEEVLQEIESNRRSLPGEV